MYPCNCATTYSIISLRPFFGSPLHPYFLNIETVEGYILMTLRKNRTHRALCCVWHVCMCTWEIAGSAWKEWKTRPTSSSISSSCFIRELQTCSTCVKQVFQELFWIIVSAKPSVLFSPLVCVCQCMRICVWERAWVHRCFCFLLVNPFSQMFDG